jgi:hypothetical protein
MRRAPGAGVTRARVRLHPVEPTGAAVRHFGRAVGETEDMHRVSDRAEWRARVSERAA